MTQNRKILLVGEHGQVAHELQRLLKDSGQLVVSSRTNNDNYIDLEKPDSIHRVIEQHQPSVIINAAAYTAVDAAENDQEMAELVNGRAPGILAELANEYSALLVHYSTDYVFDGKKQGPYTEDDEPAPLNVYGTTKLAGEKAIRAVARQYYILRTSWVYGLHGKNFLNTILRLCNERDELRIVDDQIGSPSWSRMIAETTKSLLARYVDHSNNPADYGIYHLSASGQTSWYGFAAEIIRLKGLQDKIRLVPVSTSDYPTTARRPANSVLQHGKLEAALGITLPDWKTSLQACMAGLAN